MITKEDLQQAIAECQGVRNPSANTCIKLAAYLTIQRFQFGDTGESYTAPLNSGEVIAMSGSEFAAAVDGKSFAEVLPIMDELMEAVSLLQPRLYAATIRKLKEQ